MRRARRRSEQVTVMPIVPVSPKPFYAGYHGSSEERIDVNYPYILEADPTTIFLYVSECPFWASLYWAYTQFKNQNARETTYF